MKLISKLFLIFLMWGLISVYLPQKVLAASDEGVTSFQICQQKAKQGNADAQYNLALLYYLGSEVPRDIRYAIYWYTKAAKQGHVNAQYELGELYIDGTGIIQHDSKQGIYWLTKAAEQGLAQAQFSLAYIHEYGEEGPLDYKKAFYWYTKAAEQGDPFAKEDRDEMLKKMSPSQIEEVLKFSPKELYEKIYNESK